MVEVVWAYKIFYELFSRDGFYGSTLWENSFSFPILIPNQVNMELDLCD